MIALSSPHRAAVIWVPFAYRGVCYPHPIAANREDNRGSGTRAVMTLRRNVVLELEPVEPLLKTL